MMFALRTVYWVRLNGVTVVGKGHTDELAFQIMKANEGGSLQEVGEDEYEVGDTYVPAKGD